MTFEIINVIDLLDIIGENEVKIMLSDFYVNAQSYSNKQLWTFKKCTKKD